MAKLLSDLPRKSSEIFGSFRKMFDNVSVTIGQVLENLRESSESGQKASENRQKHGKNNIFRVRAAHSS